MASTRPDMPGSLVRRATVGPVAERLRALSALASVLLAGCVVGVPATTSSPASEATATSIASGTPSPAPSATLPAASAGSAAPSATPDEAHLDLAVTGCPGGIVLEWSPSTAPAFHHYTALRSPREDIETAYPPIAPAVDWGDTYATDRFVTSAVDASILPSNTRWNYRVMAYAVDGQVVSASNVESGRLTDVVDLGALHVSAADGRTRLEWEPFSGFSGCFSFYRIMFGTTGTPTTELSVVSELASGRLDTGALHSGATYQLQVDAVRVTTLGGFVAGQTEVATYTVP